MAAVSRTLAVVAALACSRPAAPCDASTAGRADATASVAIAGLPPLPPWRALFEAARRRHVLWGDGAFPVAADEGAPELAGGDGAHPAAASPVAPLLAPPALVREALEKAPADDGALGAAVLASRRAALVYRGLASLDARTLAALAASPGLTKRIGDCCADAFAAFGGRLRVTDGRVAVPGSAEAWEALVGERVVSPPTFLPALLAAHGGRRAHLYDALARLEPARLRFAIGPDGPSQASGLRALAGVFEREPVWWGREARGYGRDDADASRVLELVRVDDAGVPGPPRTVAFWQAVFDGGTAPSASTWSGRVAASRPFDAAWMTEAVRRGPPEARRLRLAQLGFGQRAFADEGAESLVEAVVAVQALADRPALVLTLERLGLREPALYAAAVGASRVAREPRLLQASLGVVERARFARTIGAAEAGALVRSLVALPWADGAVGPAAAAWTRSELLPALRAVVADAASRGDAGAEDLLLRAMAGSRPAAAIPLVEWEGVRYRVDPAAAELARLRRVRARQGGERLDPALATCASAEPACTGALAAALVSLVYAAHIGEADGPALAGEDPSRRHEPGPRPWDLPEEARDAGSGPWHVRGALLALDQTLAPFALRRPEGDALPDAVPLFGQLPRRLLAAAAALLDPFDLVDAERDAIARAIARGRARVEALGAGEVEVEAVAAAASLDPWRAAALRWLVERDPSARRSFFSLVELLDIGRDDGSAWAAWGGARPLVAGLLPAPPQARPMDDAAGRPAEPALAEGFADLNLRVAVFLSERRLPASLAPALVRRLLPAVLDRARPVAADDRLALEEEVRRIGDDAVEDAVASLAGAGPLQPAREGAR